jgi:hypothetical protein
MMRAARPDKFWHRLSAHAAATGHRRGRLLPWRLCNHGFRGDQKTCHRGCILQRDPNDLRRVDDAGLDHVHELF